MFPQGARFHAILPSRGILMTRLLAQAIEEASRLPETLQDEIAERLLDDIHGEEQWDQTLARSADALETLANRALADFKAGRTKQMGFDEL
jgi:hypothetical protein